jgi:hypothetical protein
LDPYWSPSVLLFLLLFIGRMNLYMRKDSLFILRSLSTRYLKIAKLGLMSWTCLNIYKYLIQKL